MEQKRPDPDELLKNIKAEEGKRGRLKIFLGYVAGVGKTYAMLEAAHQRKAQGLDVVVGYIETHKRAETEELVEGLEVLPRKQVEYHNISLPEMDTDGVIERRPQLVLVDEFAHTNAPGSRHPKRYQDVQEILAVGIDVYTTLNIQHLESLNDIVAQVTGVIVRETIPYGVIDEAAEIEVIDLPPEGFVQKARKMGVEVQPTQVVTASVATVHYLCSKYPPGSRIHVVGEAALKGLSRMPDLLWPIQTFELLSQRWTVN